MAIIDAALTFLWVLTLGMYLGMLWVRRAPRKSVFPTRYDRYENELYD